MEIYKTSINHSKRVVTIKKMNLKSGKFDVTYRSMPMSKDEIEAAENWTREDIECYLRNYGVYYRVK